MLQAPDPPPPPRAARALLLDAHWPDGLGGGALRAEALAAAGVLPVWIPTAVAGLTPLPLALVHDALARIGEPVDGLLLGDPGRPELADALAEGFTERLGLAPSLLSASLVDAEGSSRHPRAHAQAVTRLASQVDAWAVDAAEVALLTGRPCDDLAALREGGRRLFDHGCPWLVLLGGRLEGHAIDLVYDGRDFYELGADRREGLPLWGAQEVFTGSLLAHRARGQGWLGAAEAAKIAVTAAIDGAAALPGLRRALPLAAAWQALGVDPAPIQPLKAAGRPDPHPAPG